MSIDGTIHARLATTTSARGPDARATTTDVTHHWLSVFEKYVGGGETPAKTDDAPTGANDQASSVGRLRLNVASDGTRTLDRQDFRPELPEPAEPGSSTASAAAQERKHADIVAAYGEQIAAATSDAERRFEERQLELALGRLEGREAPATREENRAVIGQRWAFRQTSASG